MEQDARGAAEATQMEPAKWDFSLLSLATFGCELAMIFGGVVPYIPQYLAIKSSGTTKGFSVYVCLVLIVANILRILFWFGRHYELPLVMQSILMILTMLLLVRLCVQVNASDRALGPMSPSGKERLFSDFDPEFFWRWTDFQSYVEFILCFVSLGSLLMYLLIGVDVFVESVGFLAVFTEALLGAPQFYRNLVNKSTFGMSIQMVLMWTCGDLFKTAYFVLRRTPLQFTLCGCLQVLVDVAILTQVWMYHDNSMKKSKSALNPGSTESKSSRLATHTT